MQISSFWLMPSIVTFATPLRKAVYFFLFFLMENTINIYILLKNNSPQSQNLTLRESIGVLREAVLETYRSTSRRFYSYGCNSFLLSMEITD